MSFRARYEIGLSLFHCYAGCRWPLLSFGTLGIVKRTLAISTSLSAIGFCFLMVIWPVSFHLNLSRGIDSGKPIPSDSIPILSGYRFGFEGGGVWFYNYDMPYRGSTISSSAKATGCDLPGIYFRHIWTPGYDPAYTTRPFSEHRAGSWRHQMQYLSRYAPSLAGKVGWKSPHPRRRRR